MARSHPSPRADEMAFTTISKSDGAGIVRAIEYR